MSTASPKETFLEARTRGQLAKRKLDLQLEQESVKTLRYQFSEHKWIGPRDVVCNSDLQKIKTESDYIEPKQESEETFNVTKCVENEFGVIYPNEVTLFPVDSLVFGDLEVNTLRHKILDNDNDVSIKNSETKTSGFQELNPCGDLNHLCNPFCKCSSLDAECLLNENVKLKELLEQYKQSYEQNLDYAKKKTETKEQNVKDEPVQFSILEISRYEKVLTLVAEVCLDLNSLLVSRLVCKLWKSIVTSLITFHQITPNLSVSDRIAQYIQPNIKVQMQQLAYKYFLATPQKTNDFIRKLDANCQSPILGNSVTVLIDAKHLGYSDEVQAILNYYQENIALSQNEINDRVCASFEKITLYFWKCIETLFMSYGEYVYNLEIIHNKLGLTPELLYRNLVKCLAHLPNLQRLSIKGNMQPIVVGKNKDVDFRLEAQRRKAGLLNVIKKYAMPYLRNVTALDFQVDHVHSEKVFSCLASKCPNLIHVSGPAAVLLNKNCINFRVKEMKLECFNINDDGILWGAVTNETLDRLCLDFGQEQISLEVIQKLVRRYPKLDSLEIAGCCRIPIWSFRGPRDPRLQLLANSVKTLKLCHLPQKMSKAGEAYAALLLCFPNLRTVHIEEPVDEQKLQLKKNLLTRQSLYKSRVWKDIKHLQLLTFYCYVKCKPEHNITLRCTRNGYLNYVSKPVEKINVS